jgi:uncharacterized protein (TIRG00374 family)
MSWKRWLIAAASFAAAIGVSVFLVLRSWRQAGSLAMLPVSGHILAASAMIFELLARIFKFQFCAAALRIPLKFRDASRACLGGDFAAGISPSRSAGEPARFFVLTQSKMTATNAVLLLFAELFLEMISLLAVAVLCATVFRGAGAVVGGVLAVAGSYVALVVAVGGIAFMLARRNSRGPVPGWARLLWFNAGRWRAVQRGLRQLRSGIAGLSRAEPIHMIAACVVSLAHVALRLAILPLILFSFGVRVPLAPTVLWPMALIFGGNGVPAPGGGGLVEVGFKAALGGLIPPKYFAATLIWWRFYTFYALILIGAFATGGTVMRVIETDDDRRERAHRSRRRIKRERAVLEKTG